MTGKRLLVKDSDPRLHLCETVVRDQLIDLTGRKDVKLEDLTFENTLKLH